MPLAVDILPQYTFTGQSLKLELIEPVFNVFKDKYVVRELIR